MSKNILSACLVFGAMGISSSSALSAYACWLDSYGRGVGTIPGRVADCPEGYTNYGLLCKPSGFIGTFKITKYLSSKYMRCNADETKGGIGGARCYPNNSDCGEGKESSGGLCYNNCSSGYKGVGPVCWGTCPDSLPTNCGLACVSSSNSCSSIVGDQLASVLQLAINIANLAKGRAPKAGLTAAKKPETSAEIKDNYDKMVTAFNNMKRATTAAKVISAGATEFKNSENLTEADMIRIAAEIASILDVTGVSSTVSSFSFPICSTQL